MKSLSLRRYPYSLWVVTIVLQVSFFFWQWHELQAIQNDSPHFPTDLSASAQHGGATRSIKKKALKSPQGNGIHSLKTPLPLSSESIRIFPRLNRSFPCFPAEKNWDQLKVQQGATARGFLYVKARKAGSSTVAGVAIRIARSMAKRQGISTPVCHLRFNHPMASKLKYSKRDKMESFLWSILRDPTRRFVSEFFHFGVSRNFIQPTDDNIRKYMRDTVPSINNYYLRWLSVDKPFNYEHDHKKIPSVVQSIMNEYDFLGIAERLDESLVALQMILNLTTSDMLYLSAKVNGGWDDGLYRNQCYYIIPSFVSESMKDYFQHSDEWYKFTVGDNLLYRAVNASLDKTIESLGVESFQKQLQTYRWALQKADETCRSNVTFPCSTGGNLHVTNDCMIWDSACGMECLDRMAEDLQLL
jgi:hypothetical protein